MEADLKIKLWTLERARDVLAEVLRDESITSDWSVEEFLSVLDDCLSGSRPKPVGTDEGGLSNLRSSLLELVDARVNPLPTGNRLGQMQPFLDQRCDELRATIDEQKEY